MPSSAFAKSAPSFPYLAHRLRSEFSAPPGVRGHCLSPGRRGTCLRPETLRVHIFRHEYFRAFPPSARHRYDTSQFRQKLLAEYSGTICPNAEIVGQRLPVDLRRLLIAAGRNVPTEHVPRCLVRIGEESKYGPGPFVGLRLLRKSSAHQFQIQLEIPVACAGPRVRMLRTTLQFRRLSVDRDVELIHQIGLLG